MLLHCRDALVHASVLALFGACVLGSSFAGADILLGSISPWLGLMIFTGGSDGEPDFLDGEPLATMGQEMLVSHAAQRVDFFFKQKENQKQGCRPAKQSTPCCFSRHIWEIQLLRPYGLTRPSRETLQWPLLAQRVRCILPIFH